jgi:hypothetical protein
MFWFDSEGVSTSFALDMLLCTASRLLGLSADTLQKLDLLSPHRGFPPTWSPSPTHPLPHLAVTVASPVFIFALSTPCLLGNTQLSLSITSYLFHFYLLSSPLSSLLPSSEPSNPPPNSLSPPFSPSGNNLRADGAKTVGDAIRSLSSLKTLSLGFAAGMGVWGIALYEGQGREGALTDLGEGSRTPFESW